VENFSSIHRELEQAKRIPTYTVSNFLREQMIRAGCSPEHLHTIPSPAPPVDEAFTPISKTGTPRFLYLGRLVPQKGLDWLLRAFAKVDPPAQLDIAGKGPQRNALETLADELGIRSRVYFHGWVESDRVSALMHNARSVVFPSVWHEPAGLVSLEAASHGRPLIASRVGGIPEYADESHAILVDVRDVEHLSDAITRLATDADCANRRGRNGRKVARSTFSMSQFLDRLDAFYENAQSSA
jgi:glycosyltransferase involved in cell wall biosynthesis